MSQQLSNGGKCPFGGTQTLLGGCWPRLAAGWQTEVRFPVEAEVSVLAVTSCSSGVHPAFCWTSPEGSVMGCTASRAQEYACCDEEVYGVAGHRNMPVVLRRCTASRAQEYACCVEEVYGEQGTGICLLWWGGVRRAGHRNMPVVLYILPSVACPAVPYFPDYLIKGTFCGVGGVVLHMKRVFWFSSQLLSATFHILRRRQRDITKNVPRSSCEVSLILVRFLSDLSFL